MKKIILILLLSIFLPTNTLAQELTEEERILKQSILYEVGQNYLENAYTLGNKIARWNKSKFPIKVYIEPNDTVPSYYSAIFIKAVAIWQKEASGILDFAITSSKNEANIYIKVTKEKALISNKDNIEANKTHTLAYTKLKTKNKVVEKAIIYFHERTPDGNFYNQTELLNLAVHELGHAIGISGHSEDKTSVMYPLYDKKQERNSNFLNREDKSTIKLLYSITPDITNGNPNLETGTIRAELITGNDEERIDSAIQSTYEETIIKPGDCNSRIKLASLYEEKNDLENMLHYIKEAEPLAQTADELYAVHFAYGIYYEKQKNYKMAHFHVEKASQLKSTPEINQFKKYLMWKK